MNKLPVVPDNGHPVEGRKEERGVDKHIGVDHQPQVLGEDKSQYIAFRQAQNGQHRRERVQIQVNIRFLKTDALSGDVGEMQFTLLSIVAARIAF